MKESLHHLLMVDHLLFQKALFANLKDTDLTLGQPKILEYLLWHDGTVQKEIAEACCIEPATMTSVLLGMEKKGLILRKNRDGNRRSLYVYLTDKGKAVAQQVSSRFDSMEEKALCSFSVSEKEMLISFLTRINQNMKGKEGVQSEQK